MKVHLLRCGTMCPLGGRFPSSVLPQRLTCNCLLIETAKGLVLVDTGISKAVMENPKSLGLLSGVIGIVPDIKGTAQSRIKALGFSPEDVTHIIPTHLDHDHAGGIPDFPKAKVHVFEAERDSAMSPRNFRQKSRYAALKFSSETIWQTYHPDAGEKWNGFECVRSLNGLPPEILLVSLPGHTSGHAGVAVSTEEGWIVHAGDAYYDRGAIAPRPKNLPGLKVFEATVHENRKQARETVSSLRRLAGENSDMRILCAHDDSESLR